MKPRDFERPGPAPCPQCGALCAAVGTSPAISGLWVYFCAGYDVDEKGRRSEHLFFEASGHPQLSLL